MPSRFRRLGALVICSLIACFGTHVVAQDAPHGTPFPFAPNGFPNNPEKMFQTMFGPSTPEENEKLDSVKISFIEEREYGQPIVDAYLDDLRLRKLTVVRKGPEVDYLRQLVDTIQPSMKTAKRYKKITIYFVDSPDIDARAVAGGTLFFFKGLLTFAKSEAALIGIVGHELSHLDREHLLVPLKRSRIMQQNPFSGGAGFNPQKFFSTGTTMMRLMGRPFRPEDEAAADRDGAAWAFEAGYDPRETADLFARLHHKNQDQKVPFGDFFRTHPYNEDRVDAILKQYAELKKKNPPDGKLYLGRKNLTQRIAKSQQEFPE
jgi:predicted Zn-dependent protease